MIIHKYTTHILDKQSDVPLLNDYEGKISLQVDKFLQRTIKKVLKEDSLRKAKFLDCKDNEIKKITDEILYNEKTFLENSKEIAAYLFDIMKETEQIESCDLIISLITIKDEKIIAIIKVDYKKIYNHKIDFKDDKFDIQMIENEIGISETFRAKQCALIGVNGLNDEYDLRVIDIESEKENVKSLFIEEFIKAKNIIDDTYKTMKFISITSSWINSYFNNLASRVENFNFLSYIMLNTSSIDIEDFSKKLLGNDKEAKESFIEQLESKDITNFNIDKKIAEKRFKNINLKGIFKFKCGLEEFNNPHVLKIVEDGDKYNLVIKNVGALFVESGR
ncbi:nucleoid-associated protein [Paeniclostridium sordellii]|uniref:nucleoid-associated protein n=1 Tax=Paraclostridium sordellii TaxID=1505 RepID=UPI002149CE4F|nr:nucleoid-associated protein [Paeniclostridium sordellii]MCR1851107.1 nucleoid-associated protein [Paeniclostridium sordellii]